MHSLLENEQNYNCCLLIINLYEKFPLQNLPIIAYTHDACHMFSESTYYNNLYDP